MGLADRAELVARLSLKDDFTGPLKGASRSVAGLESQFSRIGGIASKGLGTAVTNIAKIGALAAAGIGLAVRSGLQDLATLEDAITSVDGAIRQMGLAGQVTGKQVSVWANEIEKSIGAAFDDKAITQAATTLLRFGKIAPQNLRPALVVVADLATKTGSVAGASELLAKALADPEKAAGKLARSGVILTKVQQDQIAALVKAGKTAQAQALILDQLSKATAGAAAASQGPYRRALSILADVSEDAKKALAEGLLPVIEKAADALSTKLADPKTITFIREFGQGLAGAFDSALAIATKIPWESVGDAMKLAGTGAKAILDAFTSLPPWVQTAVLTGWGLNKLTGGALSGIVGELGKGLIKGVLGMNAGVVNINAGVVNGGGLPGGGPSSGFSWQMLIPFIGGLFAAQAAGEAIRGQTGIPSTVEGTLDFLTHGTVSVSDEGTVSAIEGLADQRRGEIMEGRASTAALHALLNELIGKQGGAFLRGGVEGKTIDENAGKLVQLFQTSTNPSLKSMQDNLGILKGIAAQGDPATRQALSDDIKALQALIDRKLSDLLFETQRLAAATTANAGWTSQRQGEINVNVTIENRPSGRDTQDSITSVSRFGPLRASEAS